MKYNMKNPTIEELQNIEVFKNLAVVEKDNLPFFLFEQTKKKSALLLFFYFFNLVIAGYFILLISMQLYKSVYPWSFILWQIFAGFIGGMILMIPIHELLHAIGYKLAGVKKVHFGIDKSHMLFYVEAPDSVVNRTQFTFLALIPFVIITFGLMYLFFVLPARYAYQLILILLLHSLNCIGDFALLTYVYSFKNKLFTYDSASDGKTYFYEKIA
jgi:hypothetical protein